MNFRSVMISIIKIKFKMVYGSANHCFEHVILGLQ